MSRPLRTHPEAAEELFAAAEWYEAQRPGLGGQFEAEIERALSDVASSLAVGVSIRGRHRKVRRIILNRFPYDIVFLKHDDEVVLIAFAHHSRRPGYWKRRLRG